MRTRSRRGGASAGRRLTRSVMSTGSPLARKLAVAVVSRRGRRSDDPVELVLRPGRAPARAGEDLPPRVAVRRAYRPCLGGGGQVRRLGGGDPGARRALRGRDPGL